MLMNNGILLGGILVLALMIGFSSPAYALLIDGFDNSDTDCNIDIPTGGAAGVTIGPFQDTTAGILGGERDCTLTRAVDGGGQSVQMAIDTTDNMYQVTTGAGNKAESFLVWDGTGAPGLGGIDFTQGGADSICMDSQEFDRVAGSPVRVTLYDTSANMDTQTMVIAVHQDAIPPETTCWLLSSFVGVDETLINKVKFHFDLDALISADYIVNRIYTNEMIGGEFIGVETSALLLAGAEMNSYWILPLIAVIGVGAFIYSRKRN